MSFLVYVHSSDMQFVNVTKTELIVRERDTLRVEIRELLQRTEMLKTERDDEKDNIREKNSALENAQRERDSLRAEV